MELIGIVFNVCLYYSCTHIYTDGWRVIYFFGVNLCGRMYKEIYINFDCQSKNYLQLALKMDGKVECQLILIDL